MTFFIYHQVTTSACCFVILTEGNYFITLEKQKTERSAPKSPTAFVFADGVR